MNKYEFVLQQSQENEFREDIKKIPHTHEWSSYTFTELRFILKMDSADAMFLKLKYSLGSTHFGVYLRN